jgi:hypothetical protein
MVLALAAPPLFKLPCRMQRAECALCQISVRPSQQLPRLLALLRCHPDCAADEQPASFPNLDLRHRRWPWLSLRL